MAKKVLGKVRFKGFFEIAMYKYVRIKGANFHGFVITIFTGKQKGRMARFQKNNNPSKKVSQLCKWPNLF